MEKEKKTVGRFISVLRRANGMTQQELGDRLFVSDKTVSRWERDESTPDLSLIPEIADIFGVTVDELLRGERRSADAPASDDSSRGERERKRSDRSYKALLRRQSVRFRNGCIVAVGLVLVGFLLAWLISECRFDWLREDTVAFITALIGTVASVVVLLCTFNGVWMTVDAVGTEDAENTEGRDGVRRDDEGAPALDEHQRSLLTAFRQRGIRCTVGILGLDITLLVCTVPFDIPYYRFFILAPLTAVILFVVYDLAVERILVKKRILSYPEEVWSRVLTGKKKRLKTLCTALVVTAVCCGLTVTLASVGTTPFLRGTQFTVTQTDELCAYVELHGTLQDGDGNGSQMDTREKTVKIYDAKGRGHTVRYDASLIYGIRSEEVDGQTVYTVYLTEAYDAAKLTYAVLCVAVYALGIAGNGACIGVYVYLLVKYRKKK